MVWHATVAERPSGQWLHQDRHLITNTSEGIAVATLDGHGTSNETVDHCVARLPELLEGVTVANALFGLQHLYATLAEETSSTGGGCAISVACLFGSGDVVLTTLGDTFACAGCITPLTTTLRWLIPHSLSGNAYEREAARERGGIVGNGYLHSENGQRLAMGRALGNSEFGEELNRKPVLFKVTVDPGGFVILGTDGFFRMESPERMTMSWLSCVEERMTANEILNASYHSVRAGADDATVAVAYFGE